MANYLGANRPLIAQVNVPSGVPTPAPGTQVQVGVPSTNLHVSGCASPNAFVQIFDNNAPVGTTTADSSGRFLKRITVANAQAGLHAFKFYYQDVNNRTSSVVNQTLSLSSQSDTTLNLLLPTTLEHDPEPVLAGDYLIFRGSTCPQALVNVRLDNNFTLAARADSRGNWYVIANTEKFYLGRHVYEAWSHLKSQTSQPTQKYQFNVVGSGQAPGQPPDELSPPLIIEPSDLFLSGSQHVTIRGTGPLNAQIELFQSDALVGSVFTNPLGEWSFFSRLDQPLTNFSARSCYQSSCGEFGNSVRVRYGGDLVVCDLNFRLADYRFWGLDAKQGLDLVLQESPGAASYELLIDWGDATVEHSTLEANNATQFHHVYTSHGHYNGSFTLSDEQGCQTSAFFSVLVAPGHPPNWWLLAIIPLAGAIIYFLASYLGAFRPVLSPWSPTSPAFPTVKPPQRWPFNRPWPKPSFGWDSKPDDSTKPPGPNQPPRD